MQRRRAAMVAVLLTVGIAACGPSREPHARPPDRPARVVASQTVGPRLVDLVVDSPALDRYAMVRLLLPRRFKAEPDRRWPVLWLLHGCCDTYQSWTRSTDVEELAALDEVLVVMPEGGQVGFYSDWSRPSRAGPARWETFHLTELRQLLERDWHAADRRAVAGVSMGGLGAMAYAARHPGMFAAAASYSGLLHTRYVGDPIGGGRPGPLDGPGNPEGQRIEQQVRPQSLAFVARLRQQGIPVRFEDDGPGVHDWPFWQRELHQSLPLLLDSLRSA